MLVVISCWRDLILSLGFVDRIKSIAVFGFWEIPEDGNTPLVGLGDGDSGASTFEVGEALGVFIVELSLLLRKGRDSHPLIHRDNILTTAFNKSLRIANSEKPNIAEDGGTDTSPYSIFVYKNFENLIILISCTSSF